MILRDLLGRSCDRVHVCTDDGTVGFHGLVTERLAALLDDGAGYTACFGVGPLPMMKALAALGARRRLATRVSLDPLMIDGTGMCGGCRVSVGGKTRFACIDGPFFDAEAVDFDELGDR